MDISFTPAAENAVKQAKNEAEALGDAFIGSEHILLGLLKVKGSVAYELLRSRGIEYSGTLKLIKDMNGNHGLSKDQSIAFTPKSRQILERASQNSHGILGRAGTDGLLRSILEEKDCTAVKIIERTGVLCDELICDLTVSIRSGEGLLNKAERKESAKKLPAAISKYAVPLYRSDIENDPVICRDEEIGHIIRILSRKTKNNPCLLGEPGVGKTAVVEGLAKKIHIGDVPDFLKGKILLSLDIPSMLAGAKYRGDFEERLKSVLSEASQNHEIILFIDELHTVMGAGASEGAIDASNILKPALSRGGITLIGATTTDEYRKYIERDSAFERRFQPVQIKEPDSNRACEILRGLKTRFEEHHGINISDQAIEASVSLSLRYFPNRRLPDKAIDLLDEAASDKRLSEEKSRSNKIELNSIIKGLNSSSDSDSYASLSAKLKIKSDSLMTDPVITLTEADVKHTLSQKLGRDITHPIPPHLEEHLKERIFGQDEALIKICSAIRCGMLSLSERNRPASVIMIYGESGVGKTVVGAALSEAIFGKDLLLRIDMAEYTEKHSISRLIGAPPGYVGYGEEGVLTKWTRNNPHSLILFDDAEKAHPEVLNIISTIAESGVLSCPNGKTADFRNTIILVNTTLTEKERSAGFSSDKDRNIPSSVEQTFSKSFLNKMDCVVPFLPLSSNALIKIAKEKLLEIASILHQKGIETEISDSVYLLCAEIGKKRGGARAVTAFIKTEIEEQIARYLYENEEIYGTKLNIFENNGEIFIKSVTDLSTMHIM